MASNQSKHQHSVDCDQADAGTQKQGEQNPETEDASQSIRPARNPGLHVGTWPA
jgi:hypothetical protein